MDRFQALQVFAKVAEHQSFAAAARTMSLSPPAVTRAVSGLEERLGTRLFVRTTRSVRLTEAGERFLVDVERILMDLEEAEEAAVGSHSAPRGELRVTAPVLFGRMYVTPLLGEFLDLYPLVQAQTMFVDRVVSLMDEGMDVAIRIGNLPDSSLTAVRVGHVRRVVFAAPSYLAAHGIPQHPKDLVDHRVVQATTVTAGADWPFFEDGRAITVRPNPCLRMNTNDAVIELVRAGWGLSRLLSYQVAGCLKDGSLKTVLRDFEPDTIPIHVVHQEGRLVSAKVRAFVDFMVDRLRADPALN